MGTITIAEANRLMGLTKTGLDIIVKDSGFGPAIPPAWEGMVIGINNAVQAATPFASPADITKLFTSLDRPKPQGLTLANRIDQVIGALAEGKGGPDRPGPAIPRSDIGGRIAGHFSTLDKIKETVGL